MTTAYTSLLGLALPVTGELSGTWGDTVNTAITSLLDTAVAGTTSITVDADITLSTTTGASNEARQAIILWNPASGTVTRNITAPAQSKLYTVINASGGTQSIVIRGAGPTTGVTIAKGESAQVAWNGSDFVKVGSSGGAVTFTNLTVTGNTILGDAAADTLTVNATSTFAAPVSFQGLVNLPSTGRSAAAALTVTAPAFLYGVASTYTDTTSSGTIAAMAPFYSIARPTLSTSNVTTYTNAATLYVANAPAAGGSATITNPYALYVADGANYFGGAVTLNAGTANGVAYLNGSKVLTTGSALTFDGTNLYLTGNQYFSNNKGLFINNSAGSAQQVLTLGSDNNIYFGQLTSPTAGALYAYGNQHIYVVGASEGMRLTSTGLGIGTNSPGVRLETAIVRAATITSAIFGTTGTGVVGDQNRLLIKNVNTASGQNFGVGIGGLLEANASNAASLLFYYDGGSALVEGMRLNSSGNLGIGTSSPSQKLAVAGNISVGNTGNNGIQFHSGSPAGGNLEWWVANNQGVSNELNFYYYTGGSFAGNAMSLTKSGNLGIGTSSPQARLHVVGSTWVTSDNTLSGVTADGLTTRFTGNVSYLQSVTVSSGTVTGGRDLSLDGNQLIFRTISGASFGEVGRFTNGGSLLLGTTTARNRLTVQGTVFSTPTLGTASGQVFFGETSGYGTMIGTSGFGYGWIQQQRVDGTATAYALLLQPAGGYVGVGTDAPFSKLMVAGSAGNGNGITSLDSSSSDFVRMYADASFGSAINWSTGDALRFATSDSSFGSFTERARFTTAGAFVVGGSTPVNGGVITATNSSGTVGMSAYAGSNNTTINTLAINAGSGGGMCVIAGIDFQSGASFSRIYAVAIRVSGGTSSATTLIGSAGTGTASFAWAESGGFLTLTASGFSGFGGYWNAMFINN